MGTEQFFEEAMEQSKVKAEIVYKYFWAWAKVILPTAKQMRGKIAYIDLFAGPGRYKDGTNSTPLLVLEKAIKDADMRQMLVTIFNDADEQNTHSLEAAIQTLPDIHTLKYAPQVMNHEVGSEIVKMFEQVQLIPTFFFVDPWGYKGLSLRLVNSVLKDWGCDCVFFFNYNRINMGLSNQSVEQHMNALFGEERANALRQRLLPMSPYERELTIVEEIAAALKEMGGKYVLPFGFKTERGTRTSHHLIFVTKHFRGYEIMKDIMADKSSRANQGVPTFEYSPADERQPLLFELSRPLDDLEAMLLNDYAGRSLTMRQIYEEHSIDRPYLPKNYKDVLKKLEAQASITTDPPATQRKKIKGEVTFGDNVTVQFPAKKDQLGLTDAAY